MPQNEILTHLAAEGSDYFHCICGHKPSEHAEHLCVNNGIETVRNIGKCLEDNCHCEGFVTEYPEQRAARWKADKKGNVILMARQMMVFNSEEIVAMLESHLQVAGYTVGVENEIRLRGSKLEQNAAANLEIGLTIIDFNPPPPKATPLTREDATAFVKPPPNPS